MARPCGSTEKVSVSFDVGALVLARRAAAIEDLSLSAYLSLVVQRHAWDSERPSRAPDEQSLADARTVALDGDEAGWSGGHRAAG